eukprot:Skav229837  [mRNA]  locus=scaffold2033:9238:16358:+ [translate_table: standard]
MASPAPGIWSFRDGVYLFRSPRDLTPVYRVMKKNSFLHVEPEDVNDVADHGDRRSSSSPPEVRRRAGARWCQMIQQNRCSRRVPVWWLPWPIGPTRPEVSPRNTS